MTTSAGRLLAACLAASSARRVWGHALPGLTVVPVADVAVAARLADADGRLSGAAGWAVLDDGVLRASGGPGSPVVEEVVDDVRALPEAVASAASVAGAPAPATVHLRIALDLGAPVPAAVEALAPATTDRWAPPSADVVERLEAAEQPVVLVGPGVLRAGATPGLHAVAAACSLGVLNTWGAKGVFDWRSRHHLATVGLQADDLALGGLSDADVVLACGVDEVEAGPTWRQGEIVEVAPHALDPLAEVWSRAPHAIAPVALRERLAAVTQAGWTDPRVPLHPTGITRRHAEVLGPRGLVAADPGLAGFFVARTFATTRAGSVVVPAAPGTQGAAAATVLAARLADPARPALAAVDAPLDAATRAVLEAAASLGVAVPIEVWAPDATPHPVEEHARRLREAVRAPRSRLVEVAIDEAVLDDFVAAAGAVVAWRPQPEG